MSVGVVVVGVGVFAQFRSCVKPSSPNPGMYPSALVLTGYADIGWLRSLCPALPALPARLRAAPHCPIAQPVQAPPLLTRMHDTYPRTHHARMKLLDFLTSAAAHATHACSTGEFT